MTEKGEPGQHSGCFVFPKRMQSQGMYISSTFSIPGEMTFPILNSSWTSGQVMIEAHIHNNF